jgi:hypothetical protein
VASVTVDGKTFRDASAATHHEITLDGLTDLPLFRIIKLDDYE